MATVIRENTDRRGKIGDAICKKVRKRLERIMKIQIGEGKSEMLSVKKERCRRFMPIMEKR